MVVDDVEQDRDPSAVARVDESLETLRTAKRVLSRIQPDSVVTPVSRPRALGDRHHLDRCDAQLDEVVEPTDGAVKRSFGREGPDVEFVHHLVSEVVSVEPRVCPFEGEVRDS
jgi:hypothetical protein